MLCTALAMELVGRRSDERAGHGNESWHGYQRKYHEEEKRSHGLFNTAHQGKNKYKSDTQFIEQSEFFIAKMFKK